MTQDIVIVLGGVALSGIVGYFTAQIATERRVSSLEAAIHALGEQIEHSGRGLAEQIVGVRDELRTYYERRR